MMDKFSVIAVLDKTNNIEKFYEINPILKTEDNVYFYIQEDQSLRTRQGIIEEEGYSFLSKRFQKFLMIYGLALLSSDLMDWCVSNKDDEIGYTFLDLNGKLDSVTPSYLSWINQFIKLFYDPIESDKIRSCSIIYIPSKWGAHLKKLIFDKECCLKELVSTEKMKRRFIANITQSTSEDTEESFIIVQKLINKVSSKHILIASHEDINSAMPYYSGTTFHVKQCIDRARDKDLVFLLVKKAKSLFLRAVVEDFEVTKEYFSLPEIGYWDCKVTDPSIKEITSEIITTLNIDFAHINHTIGNTFDLYYCFIEKRIPYIITCHDFYYCCPTVNFLNENKNYCFNNKKSEVCNLCLKNKYGFETNIIEDWRNNVTMIFSYAAQILFPSLFSLNTHLEYYPEIKDKASFIEYGIDINYYNQPIAVTSNDKFKIAFVGGVFDIKGSAIIEKLLLYREDMIEWHIFGEVYDASTRKNMGKNCVMHGLYNQKDIVKLLQEANIDIVCLFSICPETYCYSMTESLIAGIPVIGYNIGALKERIEVTGAGLCIEYGLDASRILDILLNLQGSDKLKEMKKKAKEIEFNSSEEMNQTIKLKYQKVEEYSYPLDNNYSIFEIVGKPRIAKVKEKFKKSKEVTLYFIWKKLRSLLREN